MGVRFFGRKCEWLGWRGEEERERRRNREKREERERWMKRGEDREALFPLGVENRNASRFQPICSKLRFHSVENRSASKDIYSQILSLGWILLSWLRRQAERRSHFERRRSEASALMQSCATRVEFTMATPGEPVHQARHIELFEHGAHGPLPLTRTSRQLLVAYASVAQTMLPSLPCRAAAWANHAGMAHNTSRRLLWPATHATPDCATRVCGRGRTAVWRRRPGIGMDRMTSWRMGAAAATTMGAMTIQLQGMQGTSWARWCHNSATVAARKTAATGNSRRAGGKLKAQQRQQRPGAAASDTSAGRYSDTRAA
jgi:hypothetical protein